MKSTVLFLTWIMLTVASLGTALDVQGRIQWNDLCPNMDALGSAKVLLDAGKISASVVQNGSFVIRDVAPGTYVLSVTSHDYIFDQLRLDISDRDSLPTAWSHILGTPLVSISSISLPYPVNLVARHKYNYFVPHESFNLLGMLQNPMMLMAVVAGVIMLVTPYLLKHLDPETVEGSGEPHASTAQNGLKKSELSASNDEPKGLSAARPQTGLSPQPRNRKVSKRR